MKKIWFTVKTFFHNLFYGMAAADQVLFSNNNDTSSIVINKEVQDKRVSKALLKGEVTQEVEELRYRTYKVARESKGFEYFSPTLAKKKDINDSKFVNYENSDNLELITIQPNFFEKGTVYEALKQVDITDADIVKNEAAINVGKFKQDKRYTIILKRNEFAIPRYYLEEYITRLVVRHNVEDDKKYYLDFYVSKYPNISDFKSKGFIKEIERVKNDGLRSDILDFTNVEFTTTHAYQMDDMIEFKFKYPIYKDIIEYDGHYIIRFTAQLISQFDMMDDFYSKTMDEKYKNKQAKDVVFNINGGDEHVEYYCEVCGKEIIYDTDDINNKPIKAPRGIDEEIDLDEEHVSEYFDIQMTEQTTGQKMCRKCFYNWLKENNIEKSNIYAGQ